MRLWSLHPKHLDNQGLLGLWRESLLALAVLEGKTKGYRNHPQLERFKRSENPVNSLLSYMTAIRDEMLLRGWSPKELPSKPHVVYSVLPVTIGQIAFETMHLYKKVVSRCGKAPLVVCGTNPIFYVTDGDIETWEKIDAERSTVESQSQQGVV